MGKTQFCLRSKLLLLIFNHMFHLYFFHWFKSIEKWVFSQYALIRLIWKKSLGSVHVPKYISLCSIITLLRTEHKNVSFFNMKNSSEPYGSSFTRLHLIDSSDIDPASQFSHKQISQKSKPNGNPERSQSIENLCCF